MDLELTGQVNNTVGRLRTERVSRDAIQYVEFEPDAIELWGREDTSRWDLVSYSDLVARLVDRRLR